MPDRLNWASIQVGDEVVALPWQARDELLDRARPLEPLQSLRKEIEVAGQLRLQEWQGRPQVSLMIEDIIA